MARRQGSITKLGDDRWRVRWFVGTDASGKREYGSEVVRGDKKTAAKKLTQKLSELARGVYVKPTAETLDEYLNRWLDKVAANKAGAKTLALYRRLLRVHVRPALGSVKLQSLDTRRLQEWANAMAAGERPLSSKTIRETFGTLRRALGKAVVWDLISRNPTDGVELPRGTPRRDKRPLSADEVRRFRESAKSTHCGPIFDLLLATGMRPGEVLGLRWSDVDFDAGTVSVRQAVTDVPGEGIVIVQPKTPKSVRTIPVAPGAMAALRRHKLRRGVIHSELGLVFPTRSGKPIHHRNLRTAYLKVCKAAGIEGARGPYGLRHSAATLMVDAGVPIRAVSERLGHANASITLNIYVHSTPAQHDQAAAVLGALLD